MHNKSFTVDNSMTIVGGRNIAEEYFELDQDVIFDDYEVLAVGPVVNQVSAGFDLFWNSELAVPIEAFGISVDTAGLDDWRAHIRTEAEPGGAGIYAQAINSQVLLDIREGRREPLVARAELVTDAPEKLVVSTQDAEAATLAREMAARLGDARSEIIIITPYFIPGKTGIEMLRELEQRGVRVVIVTNSLASTNHVPVHSAYAGYRPDVLRTGAELFELRVNPEERETEWGHSPERVTLHSKAVVIDRETIFVGSLNFDPRSIQINTEMGLFIDSVQAGSEFAEVVINTLPDVSYRLELDKDGRIQWMHEGEGVLTSEPGAGWGRRFMAGLYSLLPLESQL
jgi:putative cardiolipin synthase